MNKNTVAKIARTAAKVTVSAAVLILVADAAGYAEQKRARKHVNDWIERLNDATEEQKRIEGTRRMFDDIINSNY